MRRDAEPIPSSKKMPAGTRGSLRWFRDLLTTAETYAAAGVIVGQQVTVRVTGNAVDALVMGTVAGLMVGYSVGIFIERVKRHSLLTS